MASFGLTVGSWTQIVAPGGSIDQQVRATHGQAVISLGAPDAGATYPRLDTLSQPMVVPAGIEIQARGDTPGAIVTTGDW